MKKVKNILRIAGLSLAIGSLLFPNSMKVEAKGNDYTLSPMVRRAETTCKHEGGQYWDGTWQCCGKKEVFSKAADSEENNGWNSNFWHIDMDGSKSWAVEVDFRNERLSTATENADNFVAEVFSCPNGNENWDIGGWTFRADWCGWAGWTNDGSAVYDYFTPCWIDFPGLSTDMNVNMLVKFDANSHKLSVRLQYHTNKEHDSSIDDMKMIYYTNHVVNTKTKEYYNDTMRFRFGAKRAKLTVNTIKVLNESETKAAQFAEEWNYMFKNGNNSICTYLHGTNISVLKDLVARYNVMTNEEQERAGTLIWNDTTPLDTTIKYIESYLAVYGEPKQTSLAHGNYAVTNANSSTYLVISIFLIGILAIAGYYFVNKKRVLK